MNFDPPKGYIFPAVGDRQHLHCKMPCKRWFEYHCWEDEQSCDAELWHHTHQQCTVLRRLTPNESDCEMYEIQFADGFKKIAFWDEILRSRKQFERPDYSGTTTQRP